MQTDATERKRRAESTPPREQTTQHDIDRTDFAASIMRQLRAELHSELNNSLDRVVDKVSQSLLARLDEVRTDLDTVQDGLKHVSARADALETDVDEKYELLKQEIAALREETRATAKEWPPISNRWNSKAGCSSEQRPPRPSSASSTVAGIDPWDKPPDPAIIRVNTADAVAIDAITACLKKLIAEMSVGEYAIAVSSPGAKRLASRWVIEFPGAVSPATAVERILAAMRGPEGWRRPTCATPSGGETKVYVGPDKNIRQIKMEVSSKALAKLLGSMYPDKTFVHRKSDGTISCDYKRIARVVVSQDNSQVEFNLPMLQDLGFPFDKEEVKRLWSLDARGGAATWST